jgi:predicted DNA repair protein MutK
VASSSLLTLIDDIATLLDDVAILSKVAAKKTAGVLGDDLALNAEQVSGVKADRELPVVWAVTKGSFLNKLILVPAALAISAFAPPLITILLVIGGLFLCYEGVEKVVEKLFHHDEQKKQHHDKINHSVNNNIDLVTLEKDKIKGAIRTDFILSAEIVVIVLGTLQDTSFEMQVLVLSTMALLITVGVYGLVAAIVKLDDLGLYLLKQSLSGSFSNIKRSFGRGLLIFAPLLMKTLGIVGTIAMFLVGGGIIVHSIDFIHHIVSDLVSWANSLMGIDIKGVISIVIEGLVGIIAGAIILPIVSVALKLKKSIKSNSK